ncbi:MAG: family tricarboxylate transporter, receptor protein, partial [Betaproteobacteria bacterium]|nr:family tricarboxylate transporter, receptor protein [Betaproteobacteria bacterium]
MVSRWARSWACCACVAAVAGPVDAQSYPTHAVRMIVPFAAGGGTDFIARVVAQKLAEAWRQPVVVDNRPGGTTIVGAELVAKAPPDGYTLLVTPVPFSIVPSLAKLAYDPLRDFEHIGLLNTAPLVFIVNPSVPARTVGELVALAKARPGGLNFGSSGTGSSNHLAGELFNAMA